MFPSTFRSDNNEKYFDALSNETISPVPIEDSAEITETIEEPPVAPTENGHEIDVEPSKIKQINVQPTSEVATTQPEHTVPLENGSV